MLPVGAEGPCCGGVSNGCECFRLRPSRIHDAKWKRVDLQDSFREPLATRLWFHLLADGELESCCDPAPVNEPQTAGEISKNHETLFYVILNYHNRIFHLSILNALFEVVEDLLFPS